MATPSDRCAILIDGEEDPYRISLSKTPKPKRKMTNIDKAVVCTSGGRTDWSLYSRKGEAELEKLDLQAGRKYVPMDVYIDTRTIKKHFQAAPIFDRWAGIH